MMCGRGRCRCRLMRGSSAGRGTSRATPAWCARRRQPGHERRPRHAPAARRAGGLPEASPRVRRQRAGLG
eukprot:1313608-Rhodomonas_salina.1